MTAAQVLELLTKGPMYELHSDDCDRDRLTSGQYEKDDDDDMDELGEYIICDCPGPDLLKEIKEVLRHVK